MQSDRAALFIDGSNIFAASKMLGFTIDYKKLYSLFNTRFDILRAYYYTAIVEDVEYTAIRPLVDWLDYNGFAVVSKATKEFTDPTTGRKRMKGNMDIELAVDMMDTAQYVQNIILFTGDGDFRSLVEAVQRKGVRVTVVSTVQTQPPILADELRRQADEFIDLLTIRKDIARDEARTPSPIRDR